MSTLYLRSILLIIGSAVFLPTALYGSDAAHDGCYQKLYYQIDKHCFFSGGLPTRSAAELGLYWHDMPEELTTSLLDLCGDDGALQERFGWKILQKAANDIIACLPPDKDCFRRTQFDLKEMSPVFLANYTILFTDSIKNRFIATIPLFRDLQGLFREWAKMREDFGDISERIAHGPCEESYFFDLLYWTKKALHSYLYEDDSTIFEQWCEQLSAINDHEETTSKDAVRADLQHRLKLERLSFR